MWEEREGVAPGQKERAGEESPVSEGARILLRLMKPEQGRESAGKCHRKHTALCVFTHKVRVKRCGKSAPRKGEGKGGMENLAESFPAVNPYASKAKQRGTVGAFFSNLLPHAGCTLPANTLG